LFHHLAFQTDITTDPAKVTPAKHSAKPSSVTPRKRTASTMAKKPIVEDEDNKESQVSPFYTPRPSISRPRLASASKKSSFAKTSSPSASESMKDEDVFGNISETKGASDGGNTQNATESSADAGDENSEEAKEEVSDKEEK